MSNEVDRERDVSLQVMMGMECPSCMPEPDLSAIGAVKIPLADLSALGVAFKPLTAAIENAVAGSGGSGIYYVNTKGMQMFSTGEGFIGSLKSATGSVGGGQARMTALSCDPTMLFMAVALMNIEKKLNTIQETQKEILEFLKEKERATLQGNFNVLSDIMGNFKYNWDNDTYKTNKHILVQQIKKEAEGSIVLYHDQITKSLKKRSFIHSDQEVKSMLKRLQAQFRDYRLALYLHAYSAFLEVMLLGNFSEGYLNSVERRISDYSYQYRSFYTECYNLVEDYSKSSIQTGMLNGLAKASRFMGDTIAKVPVIRKAQLDESLIEAGGKLDGREEKRTAAAMESFAQNRMNVTQPFIENIRMVNELYNKAVTYLFDGENVYIQKGVG